jgi:hypothetical protein
MRVKGTHIDWSEGKGSYDGIIPEHRTLIWFFIEYSEKFGDWHVSVSRWDVPGFTDDNPFNFHVLKNSLAEATDTCENWARKFMSDRNHVTGTYR